MLKFIWFLLAALGLSAFVLFDSKALQFEAKSLGRGGHDLIDRQAAEPVFRGERLKDYYNKLVSKFRK